MKKSNNIEILQMKITYRGKKINKPWFFVISRKILRSKCGNMRINTFFGKGEYII